ncbi:MAG: FkbM family methyltransferase [Alphaproteobacteria bacterium]|nr:FkbM family methyltransferase [Alphaproteobacteria bacterium]
MAETPPTAPGEGIAIPPGRALAPDFAYDAGPFRLRACRNGPMMFPARDAYIGRSLELYGEFSPAEARFLAQTLRPGMVVVEVGANIGAHTVGLARAIGPAGRVLAFEPQRILHQLLCANLSLNAIGNVIAHRAAAGAARGDLRVPAMDYARPGNFGAVSLGAQEKGGGGQGANAQADGAAQPPPGERVAVLPLDEFGLRRLDLLKIDAEGMENEVIAGAADTIGRCRPVLYLENDRRPRSAELIGRLQGLGYRLWWHLPPLYSPDNFRGQATNVFPRIVSVNMLGLPPDSSSKVEGLRPVAGPEDWWQNRP